jgi:hypothetical protein
VISATEPLRISSGERILNCIPITFELWALDLVFLDIVPYNIQLYLDCLLSILIFIENEGFQKFYQCSAITTKLNMPSSKIKKLITV